VDATITDGVVVLRPPTPEDREALVATRDAQSRRFLGEGSPDPQPTFCILSDGRVLGWVDHDRDQREWLTHDEVNVGYALHPDARGRGWASRAVMLLLHHLAQATDVRVATLAIDADNPWSLGVAHRCGFAGAGTITGERTARFFRKAVPPLTYTDGVVTIRRPSPDDAESHTAMVDEEQIRWLWLPGHREGWEAMSSTEQREHQRRYLDGVATTWGTGPKWTFAVERAGEYVGHVDCDLANPGVPIGEANVSYSAHPEHRGKGYVSRAVRLILQFVRDHTGAREAWIGVDERNEASLRVARAVGALERDRHVDDQGNTMVRHVFAVTR